MRKPYVTPQCREYHIVEVNQMICQSVVEVTFKTDASTEWDGVEDRVDLCRERKGIWSEATEW